MNRDELDVGLFLNTPVFHDAEKGYSADYLNLLDFALEVGKRLNSLVLFLPVRQGNGAVPFELPSNVDVVHFPYYNGPFDLLKKSYRILPGLIRVSLSRRFGNLDSVGVVAPSTIGTTVAPFLYLRRKSYFLIMRGDKRQTVAHSYAKEGVKGNFLQNIVRFYDWVTRQMLASGQTTLFAFGDLRQQLAEYGYDTERIQIMTPLIPESIITESRTSVSNPIDLLFVGRLAGEKGLYVLLEAFEQLLSSGLSSRLHIVGDGPEADGLKEWVDTHGIAEQVIFHGFVSRGDQLWDKFDQADVFVLPSYTEGFPRVLGEAMARGLPTVSTNVGGIPDLIENRHNGLLVEPGSPDVLSERIHEIIDHDLYESISKHSIETARTLTFEQEAERVVETIAGDFDG